MTTEKKTPQTRANGQKPKKRSESRLNDLECTWIIREFGQQYEEWRSYASGWMKAQEGGLKTKLGAIVWFIDHYLIKQGLQTSVLEFLSKQKDLPNVYATIEATTHQNPQTATTTNNFVHSFLDWVILKDFVVENDYGTMVPGFMNPVTYKVSNRMRHADSVYNALPYYYLKELAAILCPKPEGNFSDWTWAQNQYGNNRTNTYYQRNMGDWYVVDRSLIDESDPDCVWRKQTFKKGEQMDNYGKSISAPQDRVVYEMWCPARAVALFVKLQLPLRTLQVRLLDSGESDTYRFENGNWTINTKHPFVRGTASKPYTGGVFKRMLDQGQLLTGLYVNSNKTNDRNKDPLDRGYTIPYRFPQVAYWLEKLRNWQEKYNPIDAPLPCTELEPKHFAGPKTETEKRAMGSRCFLFRTPFIPNEEQKPLPSSHLTAIWYNLLEKLEHMCSERGEKYSDGTPIKFVYPKKSGQDSGRTYYPLHSLRVSLITCYAVEGALPPKVLSSMLAGHARLEMTYYYQKLNPGQVHEMFKDAEQKLEESSHDSLRLFLDTAAKEDLSSRVACHDENHVYNSIRNANPIGWVGRHCGLCLVGGNHNPSENSLNGCWNGGAKIGNRKDPPKNQYLPVPNGPENCVRCRWFATDATYLPQLVAHFNNLSYRASLARDTANEHEQNVEALENERSQQGAAFEKLHELQEQQALMERQLILADELLLDMTATYQLVTRVMEIEKKKDGDSARLIAVGSRSDLEIGFHDLDTELSQIASVCADAQIYASEADELLKTPAVGKLADKLNRALMREGYAPVLMNMDDRMKLAASNAMMEAMARKINPDAWRYEGLSVVAGLLEAGHSLKEQGLLGEGLQALENKLDDPVYKLGDLVQSADPQLSIVEG